MEGQEPKMVSVMVAEKLLQDYDTALMGARNMEGRLLNAEQCLLQSVLDCDQEAYEEALAQRDRVQASLDLAKNQAAALSVTIAKKALQDWMTPGTPVFPED